MTLSRHKPNQSVVFNVPPKTQNNGNGKSVHELYNKEKMQANKSKKKETSIRSSLSNLATSAMHVLLPKRQDKKQANRPYKSLQKDVDEVKKQIATIEKREAKVYKTESALVPQTPILRNDPAIVSRFPVCRLKQKLEALDIRKAIQEASENSLCTCLSLNSNFPLRQKTSLRSFKDNLTKVAVSCLSTNARDSGCNLYGNRDIRKVLARMILSCLTLKPQNMKYIETIDTICTNENNAKLEELQEQEIVYEDMLRDINEMICNCPSLKSFNNRCSQEAEKAIIELEDKELTYRTMLGDIEQMNINQRLKLQGLEYIRSLIDLCANAKEAVKTISRDEEQEKICKDILNDIEQVTTSTSSLQARDIRFIREISNLCAREKEIRSRILDLETREKQYRCMLTNYEPQNYYEESIKNKLDYRLYKRKI